MKRILKRFIKRNDRGEALHEYIEIIADNGVDTAGVFSVETFKTCDSCHRPLKPNDPRGACQICQRMTCSCGVTCAVCSRNICGNPQCRFGIAEGQIRLTVCPICYPEVRKSLLAANKFAVQKAKLQLVQSSLLDRLPGIGIVRQLAEISLLKQLDELDKEMRK